MTDANPLGSEVARTHLVRRVPTARPDERAGTVRDRLVADDDEVDQLYVVDDEQRLVGTLRVARLLRAPADARMDRLMQAAAATVPVDLDQEHVALAAIQRGLVVVPVADAAGRFLGIVPARALIEILFQEHAEDLRRLAGIRRGVEEAEHAITAPPVQQLRERLPWLLVGLVGSALATLVVSRFEYAIESRVALAFFVPAIVYMADAIGTQTEAIVVRGLSLGHATLPRLLASELATGALVGLVLGAFAYAGVMLAFGDGRLALAVALSLVAAGTVASAIGLVLPWALARAGSDPAFGSGPLATVIQDVVSLVIYFALATWLVT